MRLKIRKMKKMIIGLGTDIVKISRVNKVLDRFEGRFIKKAFTPKEQQGLASAKLSASYYAKRFAAKEACGKALGTGIMTSDIKLHDIEVSNDSRGKPEIVLKGGAKRVLESLVPAGKTPQINLSLSDEAGLAQATVIISAY